MASATDFRQLNMQTCQLHCLLTLLLWMTTETSTFSLTNWTYLQNLFIYKSVQHCSVLSNMQRFTAALSNLTRPRCSTTTDKQQWHCFTNSNAGIVSPNNSYSSYSSSTSEMSLSTFILISGMSSAMSLISRRAAVTSTDSSEPSLTSAAEITTCTQWHVSYS